MSFSARGSSNSNRTASRRRNVQRSALPFCRVSQAGSDIIAAQLGELRQKLILGSAAGQVLKYVTDCNPRTPNARLAESDGWVNRDSIKALHQTKPTPVDSAGNPSGPSKLQAGAHSHRAGLFSAPNASSSASVAGATSRLPRPRLTTASGVCPW